MLMLMLMLCNKAAEDVVVSIIILLSLHILLILLLLLKQNTMSHPHSPSFLLCQEQHSLTNQQTHSHSALTIANNNLLFEHDYLISLFSKEKASHFTLSPRYHVVRWISRVSEFHGFTSLTTVLAVNYFDRFATAVNFQREKGKQWMTQLAAVACVSLAAKVEETRVPLLLDLQVEESKFVFEAKSIQRMELLVLSTLEWKMNPVTPISFFQHIFTKLGLNLKHLEFLSRCERVLLSVITDSRVMSYLPSTLAAAIMIHVIKEIEPSNAAEYRNQVLGLLQCGEEQVDECYKLILRVLVCCEGIHNLGRRGKRLSEPSSPAGVIDASFSCDSSNDSWAVTSHSVEPVFKRRKVQEQQMRLPSLNRVSIGDVNTPR